MKRRVCRPWSSAAELGSAVKSAILNELEFNLKPGWIRADALPTSEDVAKMKQRIADLEEKLKQRKPSSRDIKLEKPGLPDGDQLVEIPVTITFDFQTIKQTRIKYPFRKILDDLHGEDQKDEEMEEYETEEPQKEISRTVSLSLDELILKLASDLQTGSRFETILQTFNRKITGIICAFVEKETGTSENTRNEFTSSNSNLNLALKTLMANKMVKMISSSNGWHDPLWRFTPKGLQHLAELQAFRKSV